MLVRNMVCVCVCGVVVFFSLANNSSVPPPTSAVSARALPVFTDASRRPAENYVNWIKSPTTQGHQTQTHYTSRTGLNQSDQHTSSDDQFCVWTLITPEHRVALSRLPRCISITKTPREDFNPFTQWLKQWFQCGFSCCALISSHTQPRKTKVIGCFSYF